MTGAGKPMTMSEWIDKMDNPSYVAILMNKNPALAKLLIAKKNGQIRAAAKRNAHTEAASITTPFRNVSMSKPGGALLASNSSDLSGLGNVYANNLDNGVQALDMALGGDDILNDGGGTKFETADIGPKTTSSFDGFWGGVNWLLSGGTENGLKYDWNGNLIGYAPIGGVAPTPGKPSKFTLQLTRQLLKDGPKSVLKTLKTLQKQLQIHKDKLPNIKYKSSVEREIRTFEKQIQEAINFIEKHL